MASIHSKPHFVVIPLMSKGHTIPILHLVHLLLNHNTQVTIFTTHANSPFIHESLADTQASIINLSFPQNVDPQLPSGIESTDKLPSMSLFFNFLNATKHIQPEFDQLLQSLSMVSCIISDSFLWWTMESATKLGVPRLIFNGMNMYSGSVSYAVFKDQIHTQVDSDDELFSVPSFPWIQLTRNDFEHHFLYPEPGLQAEIFQVIMETTSKSKGLIVNSFYELEPKFVEYWKNEAEQKAWFVGLLCLADPPKKSVQPHESKSIWVEWLDEMLARGKSVMYVAFGSQAEISTEQSREIAIGLENSGANFLWVIRSKNEFIDDGLFEERVKGRGLVVREWVDQVEILCHECVDGFMSHCGWNSVTESIKASVPILAWPMMAEQHLNTRMVVEELGIGLRVLPENGSVRGFVNAGIVEKMVRELMEGDEGKQVRKKVKEIGEAARTAMGEGGSSRRTLALLIDDVCGRSGDETETETLT